MAASALKLAAAVAVCLVLVLSAGQPAAAAFTACGDCHMECGAVCDKYADLFCNSVCYKTATTPSCDADCQHTACQNCKNLAFPDCATKCGTGCKGVFMCPPS